MTSHQIAQREQWRAAYDELGAEEKDLTRRNDALAGDRQAFRGCRSRPTTASKPTTAPRRLRSCDRRS